MITETLLRTVCAHAAPGSHPLQSYLTAFSSVEGTATLAQWQIDTPARLAAFFANVCHETGAFTVIRESMNYVTPGRIAAVWPRRFTPASAVPFVRNPVKLANKVYGGRLGNEKNGTNDDDGFRFRGGGPLQATGADFYAYLAKKLAVPFDDRPELIENPQYWVAVACLTWRAHPSAGDLNIFADVGNFKGCCLGINYGNGYVHADPIGWSERQRWFTAWRDALAAGQEAGKPADVASGVLRQGAPRSETVLAAQKRLNALGYAEKRLTEDGLFGPRLRSAVQDFQTENGLPVTGELDAAALARLMSDDAIAWPVPAAAVAGVEGLRKVGDADVTQADADKTHAVVLASTGGALALKESGLLDLMTQAGDNASTLGKAVTQLAGVAKLGAAVVIPATLIYVAWLLWRRYGARIEAIIERWSRPV